MNTLTKMISILASDGPLGLLDRGLRKSRGGRMRRFGSLRAIVDQKIGIEIGGPSPSMFGELVPIYRYAGRVDNCNFATSTLWEPSLSPGQTFVFYQQRSPGTQYICEAVDLSHISDETYDFVISSHVIEHIADPIRA